MGLEEKNSFKQEGNSGILGESRVCDRPLSPNPHSPWHVLSSENTDATSSIPMLTARHLRCLSLMHKDYLQDATPRAVTKRRFLMSFE